MNAQVDRLAASAMALVLLAAPVLAQGWQGAHQRARALAGAHPSALYQAAGKRFGDGAKDEAVFLFYLGQLRWRSYLLARPDLPPDGDPALFAAMNETLGRPINEWAFGDIDALLALLEDVKAFDARNPDMVTPRASASRAHDKARAGLDDLIAYIAGNVEDIRAARRQNGLKNR